MNAQSSFRGDLEPMAARWLLAGRIRGRSWFVSCLTGLRFTMIVVGRVESASGFALRLALSVARTPQARR
jgi:hypothetical protein